MQKGMRKKGAVIFIAAAIVAVLCVMIGYYLYRQAHPLKAQDHHVVLKSTDIAGSAERRQKNKERIQATQSFINRQLSGKYGVYTNWADTAQNQESATGHEVLSESYGLLLQVYALEKNEPAFKQTWNRLQKVLSLDTGWSYRYSPALDKKYPVNASVDDLRILYALRLAATAFHRDTYNGLADRYGERFIRYMVRGRELYDFYDNVSKKPADRVTLCYIQLKWLSLLPMDEKNKAALMSRMSAILRGGYISDRLPFYETRYSYTDGVYEKDKRINTTESLLSILPLAEMKKMKPESIRFISDKVANRQLDNAYNRDGTAADRNQSAANYAIVAMIAVEIHDRALYNKSIEQLNTFQIRDKKSMFNGGFGYPETKAFYSFNNLMGLLAYNY